MDNLIEENFNFRDDLYRGLRNYYEAMQVNKARYGARFGRGRFYQSLDGIVDGQRPTGERIIQYRLLDFIKKDHNILDLGSNCGFFSLSLSSFANKIRGIEISPELVNIANIAKSYLKASNCQFEVTSFNNFKTDDTYDFVFCLAVHGWVKTSFEEFIERVNSLVSPDGYVLFESHNLENEDKDIDNKEKIFSKYYNILHSGFIKDDGKINRKFFILKKK